MKVTLVFLLLTAVYAEQKREEEDDDAAHQTNAADAEYCSEMIHWNSSGMELATWLCAQWE